MNKSCLVFLFLFIQLTVYSQQRTEFLERDAFEFALFLKSPSATYRKKIESDYVNSNSLGLSFSYLRNPLLKKDNLSQIFLGGEIGFTGNKQREFTKMPPEGTFYMAHRETHLYFKTRYLAKITPENYIPYLDIHFGPKFYTSSFFESLGEDEQEKFYTHKDVNFGYGIEAGISIKSPETKSSTGYFNISAGYGSGNAVTIINRNKIGLDNQYSVIEPLIIAKPQNIYIKLSYINFR